MIRDVIIKCICACANDPCLLCCLAFSLVCRHKSDKIRLCRSLVRPATLIVKFTKRSQNVKNKKCIAEYFASLFSLFTFRSILCQSRHLREKSKDFVVYFFAALIKHEIRMKYGKCIVSILYFVVCFVKTFAKYPQNAKYGKCVAALEVTKLYHLFVIFSDNGS